MSKGPRGESRPSDPIAAAIMSARIATGEINEEQATAEVARMNRRKSPHGETDAVQAEKAIR